MGTGTDTGTDTGADVGTGALPAGLGRAGLVDEVRRVCDARLDAGAAAVLAVSGGPDSVALAHLVTEGRPDLELSVAHVRHGLRDDRSDAAVAAAHAAALEVRYLERAVTVRPSGAGAEAAARDARYAALAELAERVGAVAVLTAHSADDQAETVLLNVARGTGLRGLSAMAPWRALGGGDPGSDLGRDPGSDPGRDLGRHPGGDAGGLTLLRPLLRVRRSDIRRFVVGEGLAAVSDPTNTDPDQRRARVRTRVLPALAELTGGAGDPVGALTRLADLARADADALDAFAQERVGRLAHVWGPVRCVRHEDLSSLPTALVGRVLRLLVATVTGAAWPNAATIDALRALPPGAARHIEGGAWATSGGGWLALRPPDTAALTPRPLALPGRTALPEIGLDLCADLPWGARPATLPGQAQLDVLGPAPLLTEAGPPPERVGPVPPGARAHAVGAWVALPAAVLQGLAVRPRRPGDRLTLAHGTRKLQDLFTDHGIPRAVRDLVPVLVDADDQPLWVPGVAVRRFAAGTRAAARVWLADWRASGSGRAVD